MLFILPLLVALFFGLVLLAVGIALLLKLKNKLVGSLFIAVGLVMGLFSTLVFLSQVITHSSVGYS